MKLSIKYNQSGRTGLALEPTKSSEVVAYPRELLLDVVVARYPSDYIWTAAALAFGARLAGEFSHAPGISPPVYRAISQFVGHDVVGAKVSEEAFGRGRVGNALYLSLGESSSGPFGADFQIEPNERNNGVRVTYLDLGEWVGRAAAIDRLIFATNVTEFVGPRGRDRLAPYLAPLILISDDWAVEEIFIKFPEEWNLKVEEIQEIQRLCSTIGITISLIESSGLSKLGSLNG